MLDVASALFEMAKKNNQASDSYAQSPGKLDSLSVRAILGSISDRRDQILLRTLYETGCKVYELVRIRSMDLKTSSIVVGKREVWVDSGLVEDIKELVRGISPSGYVFYSRQSSQLNTRRVRQIVERYLGTNPNALRHLRITELAKEKGILDASRECGRRLVRKAFLNGEEVRRIQAKITDKDHLLMFRILLETGCRISELVSLKIGDIRRRSIIVGKREVTVDEDLISEIKPCLRKKYPEDYIFSTRQSGRISDKRVFQILQSLGKEAGAKLNPRILRNTKIASMLTTGIDHTMIERELGISRLEFGCYGLLKQDG